jgi:ABC-type dipeptide/oligopeptide/nickel transport system ATPase component
MCQRVMIAMALVHNPALLIADEPTTALDKKNEEQILRLFARIRETCNAGIILVSHDENAINAVADRKISMNRPPLMPASALGNAEASGAEFG